jgi:hypothetical protein
MAKKLYTMGLIWKNLNLIDAHHWISNASILQVVLDEIMFLLGRNDVKFLPKIMI